ncbi:hypothetical protein EON65_30660 [archaeon]|nr:MAG: hypothetical protein EON65_30660 [archaeon]
MKKKKSIYCRVSSSISATRFFSCFDVDSMYHNFLPRPLPADRKVTPLSLPIRTAEMSAAVTAAEAGQVSLPKADIDDAVTSDEHTISIYRTSVHNMTSPRMNSLNMLPSKPLSKQNSSSAMIDLPSGIDVDAAADLILEHHIELMRRRKPDELSYNVSSIRQVLTGVKASRRRSSHQEPSQQQRQIYTHASDSPAGSDYQPSPVQSDQLLPSADGSMKTADDDPESMGALMFSSISPPASRPRDESFDIQTLVVSEEHKK